MELCMLDIYEERKDLESIRIENLCAITLSIKGKATDQHMINKILGLFPPAILQANRQVLNGEIDPKYKNLVRLYRDVKFSLIKKNQAEYDFNKSLSKCS